ncbi:MAG: TIGR00153 family protein [Pseudomonadales bacterium]|jgi:predicted phosphate transport protein (TIGR00153 family)|nr:TIGR00153 family protein [Pseudomonadales bacterium]|tara:strand:+ start:2172 stop:2852 length:681 start_codon:yes stop_codon:yes gene_type:complete
MPSTNPLAGLFGKSPFTALQAHMRVVLECAHEVTGLFDALVAGDNEEVIAAKDRIFEKEAEADKIKNQMRGALPKSLFMPVDRRDLLELLQMQDSIADTAQDVAGMLVERRMVIPEFMREPMLALVSRCVEACDQSASIIEELDELLAMGFRGREATQVEDMVEKLNLIEDDTDELGIALARALFEHEDELNPVSVMMWYQLIEWVGDLADYAEKVGDRLRLLIAR